MEFLNKLCLHQSIPCHDIPTRGHLHSLHTYKRTFTSWHTPKQTFASWCTPKRTFASWHAPWEHSHHHIMASWHAPNEHLHHDIPTWTCTSWHTYMNICIMTYPQVDIRIIACTIRTFAFIAYLHEHLHYDIPTSGHSHHSMHHKDIRVVAYSQWDICIRCIPKRAFAS